MLEGVVSRNNALKANYFRFIRLFGNDLSSKSEGESLIHSAKFLFGRSLFSCKFDPEKERLIDTNVDTYLDVSHRIDEKILNFANRSHLLENGNQVLFACVLSTS